MHVYTRKGRHHTASTMELTAIQTVKIDEIIYLRHLFVVFLKIEICDMIVNATTFRKGPNNIEINIYRKHTAFKREADDVNWNFRFVAVQLELNCIVLIDIKQTELQLHVHGVKSS